MNPTQHISAPRPVSSFRVSVEGRDLVSALAAKLGVNRTAVLELAIRELARKEGLR